MRLNINPPDHCTRSRSSCDFTEKALVEAIQFGSLIETAILFGSLFQCRKVLNCGGDTDPSLQKPNRGLSTNQSPLKNVVCALVFMCAAGPACSDSSSENSAPSQIQEIYASAVAHPEEKDRIDAYIRTLVESPKGSRRYFVEGDIAMSRDEIVVYLSSLSSPVNRAEHFPGELIVNQYGGADDYWQDRSKRALRYFFEESSFPDKSALEFVRAHLAAAARDWENACADCGVTFAELPRNAPRPGNFTEFSVRYVSQDGGVIASSFFPSAQDKDRMLSIYTPYFHKLQFDPTGVLRHELGHILGYRHEHIVGIPGCATENNSWRMITPYTANSVMHYFCGGGGSFDLSLRPTDVQGHQCLYRTGKPCINTTSSREVSQLIR